MTPEERAEAIGQALFSSPSRQAECARMVKAAIRAAVEDAKAYKLSYWQQRMNNAKAEAYEDAAKILQNFLANGVLSLDELSQVVLAIRARAAEVGR
jgi:hypothetical protein